MRRHGVAIVFVAILGLSCKSGDEQLVETLSKAVGFLESTFDGLEEKTKQGADCYPLIDGYQRFRGQELGFLVAKDVGKFEAYFDFATVVLDVYKTPVGKRFNTLALKYQQWKSGPYAKAVEACETCMRNGHSEDEPLRPNPAACRVP